MKQLTITNGQSLLDVVVSQHGTLEALFDVAQINALSLSADLLAGQVLHINDQLEFRIANYQENQRQTIGLSTVVVTERQTLLDLVIQEAGGLEGLFDMADQNGLNISDQLQAGQLISNTKAIIRRPELVDYFKSRKRRINTGGTYLVPEEPETPAGIFDLSFDITFN